MKRMQTGSVITVAACILLCGYGQAAADPYKGADFSLRFPAALTRFSTYGDVAGYGGASAGAKWSSSTNPASIGWLDIEQPLHICTSGQFSRLWFDNGTNFDVFAESVTWDGDDLGTFLVASAQASTNEEPTRDMGMDFRFTADIFQLQWAKKLSETWAVGANFGWTKSGCRYKFGPFPILESNSDCYDIRLGTLHQLAERFLGGVVVDYGWSRDRTEFYSIPAIGQSAAKVYDRTRQFLVRPGVSYEYMKDSTVYLDYQYGVFWNDTGTLNVHRIYAGVEQALCEWIYARGGTTYDPCVETCAWTGGLGFYPTRWLSIDLAYQYNVFPEIANEFGRAQTFNVSASISF
jgi:hypothetical protein